MNKNISIISNSNESKKTAKIFFLAACLMLASAAISYANSIPLYVGGTYSSIASVVNGNVQNEGGGSVSGSTLNNAPLDYLYCVDLFTNVSPSSLYPDTTVNNFGYIHGTALENAQEVAWLLETYGTGGQSNQAKALQAAIWTVINDSSSQIDHVLNDVVYVDDTYHLNLTDSSNTTPEINGHSVDYWYTTMLTDISTKSGTISDFLWITPITGTAQYQGLVTNGPAPTPEPATMILFGLGLAGFTGLRLRKKSRKLS